MRLPDKLLRKDFGKPGSHVHTIWMACRAAFEEIPASSAEGLLALTDKVKGQLENQFTSEGEPLDPATINAQTYRWRDFVPSEATRSGEGSRLAE